MPETVGAWWMWLGFVVFVVAMVLLDMAVLQAKGAHKVGFREALGWSALWVALALAFAAWLWWYLAGSMGREIANEKTLEFLTGYLIEKSLAVDNIFVFIMIFSYFSVPPEFQRRVLLYGVLGAIVMRAIMILAGAYLLHRFHWVLYVFGAFLVISGMRMLMAAEREPDLAHNPVLRWMRSHLRVTDQYHGERFTVVRNGVRWVTPLLPVLVLIEAADLIFAVDSIPAVYAVTNDPFIVFTSNIFAILGLRAMYFLLADVAGRFRLLKYGLALVLIFIGIKMLLLDVYKVPILIALGVVAVIIAASIAASVIITGRESAAQKRDVARQ